MTIGEEARKAYIELRYHPDKPPERDRRIERGLLLLERVVYFIGWIGAVATVLAFGWAVAAMAGLFS